MQSHCQQEVCCHANPMHAGLWCIMGFWYHPHTIPLVPRHRRLCTAPHHDLYLTPMFCQLGPWVLLKNAIVYHYKLVFSSLPRPSLRTKPSLTYSLPSIRATSSLLSKRTRSVPGNSKVQRKRPRPLGNEYDDGEDTSVGPPSRQSSIASASSGSNVCGGILKVLSFQ